MATVIRVASFVLAVFVLHGLAEMVVDLINRWSPQPAQYFTGFVLARLFPSAILAAAVAVLFRWRPLAWVGAGITLSVAMLVLRDSALLLEPPPQGISAVTGLLIMNFLRYFVIGLLAAVAVKALLVKAP